MIPLRPRYPPLLNLKEISRILVQRLAIIDHANFDPRNLSGYPIA